MTTPAPRCLVIGGSGHVGSAVCRLLAGRGARVAFTYHRAVETSAALADSIGARRYAVDLREPGAAADVVRTASRDLDGGLEVLVYAAGLATAQPGVYQRFADLDEASWDLLMSVNVKAAFFATRAFADCVPAKSPFGGNVVYLSSVDGVKPIPASAHYATSKGALCAMARVVAKDLGPSNIRVNAVAPGVLEGGLASILPDDLRREYLKHSALKRVGRADEVASVVAWLALENRYATGRTLTLDGGL